MTRLRHRVLLIAMAGSVAVLAGCSGNSSNAPSAQHKSAQQAESGDQKGAEQKLKLFHQMMDMHKPQLAVSVGDEILAKYPDSAAAKEMRAKLPGIKAKATADAKAQRLANLWLYQVSPVGGGTQSTATIHNSKPDEVKVRLVLRRQTEWGTSAFLYDAPDKGFVCHDKCNLVMHFDGKRHVYKGFLPDGGEPAMFIEDYKGFIKRLKSADKIEMKVTVKGKGSQTLLFETGGFQPDKWKSL